MTPLTTGAKLAEGKTKLIYEVPGSPGEVFIRTTDNITAGDGDKQDILPGKGVLATTTTCNCFRLIEAKGVKTHFVEQVDDQTFRARRLDMFPVELVARRIATGSYLKRRPDVSEDTKFDKLVLEFFDKDDANHDPLIVYDFVGSRILRFNAKKPLSAGVISESLMGNPGWLRNITMPQALEFLADTFRTLETAWARQGVLFVDLKIECGFHQGELVVGDVIDNDSWRIWPGGKKEQQMDKQVYRDMLESTPEALAELAGKYAWVAEATEKFAV